MLNVLSSCSVFQCIVLGLFQQGHDKLDLREVFFCSSCSSYCFFQKNEEADTSQIACCGRTQGIFSSSKLPKSSLQSVYYDFTNIAAKCFSLILLFLLLSLCFYIISSHMPKIVLAIIKTRACVDCCRL